MTSSNHPAVRKPARPGGAVRGTRLRGEGSLAPLLLQAVAGSRAKDPFGQLAYILENGELQAATGRRRGASQKTQTYYGDTMKLVLRELREMNMRVPRLDAISRKNVIALVKRWVDAGLSAGHIQNRTSHIRQFMIRIGRPQVVCTGDEWMNALAQSGVDTSIFRQRKSNMESKSWESAGLDVEQIISRVSDRCPQTGIQLRLQHRLGLRANEALCFDPWVCDLGNSVVVSQGTKGGRIRLVALDQDPAIRARQRAVIDAAKEYARNSPTGKLSQPGVTLVQARKRYYKVLAACGVTRKDLGVTGHGLRHGYLQRHFESVTGLPAPVHGLVPAQVYREHKQEVQEGMRLTSLQAGHSRMRIAHTYAGSPRGAKSKQIGRTRQYLAMFEEVPSVAAAFREAGAQRVWLVGAASQGLRLAAGAAIMVAVASSEEMPVASKTDLERRLATLVPAPVQLFYTLKVDTSPQDGTEVLLGLDESPRP